MPSVHNGRGSLTTSSSNETISLDNSVVNQEFSISGAESKQTDSMKEFNRQALTGKAKKYLVALIRAAFKLFDSPHQNTLPKRKTTPVGMAFLCGGDEGNRTPVRRQLDKTFSERSLLFTFPLLHGNKHP